ncbi:DNA/RNA non-specific endonuclease [Glutamicibacter sp. MNS18]|uniref:DNA/RNA non-specific endonuclease n=1 Tax=Glutamicibacter sp. MNS18 TaxID=2989817 RepID=UPI002235A3B2|nr:DNA/RNA non-specific endonuclease [Glutamicibacter sp. MNS18]MCW4466852.1 DNA/RNA non-specific endonuclease [Glutamicibacter sp. MNS18]
MQGNEPTAALSRAGYDPDFLKVSVAPPQLDAALEDDAVPVDGAVIIPYTHFSLVMSRSRQFARWVGWNIDGSRMLLLSRSGINFTKDSRLPGDLQIGNELYQGNRLDRGHLARRSDLLWGEMDEAWQANRDSFFYTNIAPQMDDFNQSRQNGIWGMLENALYDLVDVQDLRASVFAGPVFHVQDWPYRNVPLPAEYWKLLAYRENGILKARAFLLTQDLDQLRAVLALDEFRVYQITLPELEDRTQLRFPKVLHDADDFSADSLVARQPLDSRSDIFW